MLGPASWTSAGDPVTYDTHFHGRNSFTTVAMATHLLRVRATFSFCLQVETHSTKNVRCLLALDFFSLEDQRGIGCQILPFCAPRRKKRIGRVAATRRGVPAHRSLVPVAEKAIDRRFIFSAGPKIVETRRAEIFVFFKKKKTGVCFHGETLSFRPPDEGL